MRASARILGLVVLCASALAPRLVTGQGVTALTGSVNGTVKDGSGAIMPGVTVVIASPSQMGTREAVTSREGTYRFATVPPGEYTVTFSLAGFSTIRFEGIRLNAGFTATVDAQLQPARVEEQITVTGQAPVVDRAATVVGTTFDATTMGNLPNSRDLQAILLQTPAVTVRGGVDVGGSNLGIQPAWFAYGNTNQTRMLVEGIETSEGNGNNGAFYNFGAFEEVQVNAAANSADMPTPGLQIQMISKSGSNQYRGEVFSNYENGRFQSSNIDADQIARGVTGGGGLSASEVNRLSSFHTLSGDVGGYIKKDTLWWHSALLDEAVAARLTNYPGQIYETKQWNVDLKTTYSLSPAQKLVGYVAWNRKLVPSRINSFIVGNTPIVATQADTSYQDFRSPIVKGEWNGILSDKTFLEIRGGTWSYVSPFAKQPELVGGPHYEDLAAGSASGTSVDRYLYRWRHQAIGTLSTVKGNHTLKTGLEYLRDGYRFEIRDGSFGNIVHILQSGSPIEVYLQENPVQTKSGLDTYSAYVVDNWRLGDRLSVNLGLRYDRYHGFLPQQVHPADQFATETTFPAVDQLFTWNVVAPRMGMALALDNSQRTLVKVNYGVYQWGPSTNLPNMVNPNPQSWWKRYAWTDTNGNRVWDSGEQGRLLGTAGGTGSAVLDPGIKDTFTREAAAWLEREVGGAMAVRTGVVWRREQQAFRAVNTNQPFEAFNEPVTIADPGPDGIAGNADDGTAIRGFNLASQYLGLPTVNLVTNLANTDASHWTWEASAVRRMRHRWAVMATGSYTRSAAQALPGATPPLYSPNRSINAGPDGELHYSLWSAKLHATWEAPAGLVVTPMLMHESGQNFGRTIQGRFNFGTTAILAEPIDARRTANITMADLRVEKRVRLSSSVTVGGFVDALNMFNANPEQQLVMTSGASFLRPQQILPPRLLRVGARLEW